MTRRRLVAACLMLLCVAPAYAQFDSATISGVVQDTTGAILPGVDVTLTNVGTKIARQAVTNEAGLYTFPNVPVGEYQVTAMLSGFKPITKAGVQVNAGLNIRVDVALEVGALSETIQVQAATTMVDILASGFQSMVSGPRFHAPTACCPGRRFLDSARPGDVTN